MKGRTIWCLGMYASASTWLFNVVRQIYQTAAPAIIVRPHFFSMAGDFSDFGQDDVIDLAKSHEIGDAATVLQLARRADRIFVTMRDPRDAVASLMTYHKHDFERACGLVEEVASLCADLARDRRTLYLNYESGFPDAAGTVALIAAHLDVSVSGEQAQLIAQSLSRGKVEQYIAKMPAMRGILQDRKSGDRLDPKTHWHTHHAGRSGEAGRWRRELNEKQAAEVIGRLHSYYDFASQRDG